jgi:hypothetical protein
MILIRRYSDIFSLRRECEVCTGLTAHLETEWAALFSEAEEEGDDHDTVFSQQHTHVAILEKGDTDLKPVGLLGNLCDQWLEFVEMLRPEGAQAFYRIGILADNEYFVLLYAAQDTLDPETESWLADRAQS